MDIKLLGPIGLMVGWFAIILLLVVWGADKSRSISYHSARHRKAFLTYGSLISLSLLLLFVFGMGWLRPHYGLPLVFGVFYIITVGCFSIATWIPVTGKRGKLHDRLAGIATLSMVPILATVSLSQQISTSARIVAALGVIVLGLLFVAFKATKGYHLVIQVAYFLVFDITLVAVAFL